MKSAFRLQISFCISFTMILIAFAYAPLPAYARQYEAPEPALWKITDHDSEIFLFGTVHILNPDLNWRSEKINRAFAKSDTIIFEAPADASNPQKMQSMIAKYGINRPGTTLSSLLSPEGNASLKNVLAQFGMQGGEANFEPLRPWLVGITLAGLQIQANGGDPNAGVERILGAEAGRTGKKVGYLETDEQQMQFLSSLSAEAELFFLEDGLRQMQENPDQINDLVSYWIAGDVAALNTLLVTALAGQQEVYDALLVNRNRDWADQIGGLLRGSGTIFIAVGAAHLAGDDSLQALLATQGIAARRQ